jgi:GH25 family lysozyme M1 (1,4-beta-N-acetylmuramidase)
MEGIDIYSKFQTVTDWNQVRAADIGWCYQKVSDGTGTRIVQSPADGRAAGVLQGGYHFSQVGDPVEQANLLVDRCTTLGLLDLNPALDLEDNPPGSSLPNIPDSQKADWAVAFGRQVMARGHGFTLYANDSTWGLIRSRVTSAIPEVFRWVARYRTSPPDNPWDAWQYTSSGSVPGIAAGSVDRNKGKIPLNGVDVVALTDDDLNKIHAKVWYTWIWSQNNGATGQNASQVLSILNDSTKGLSAAVTALKDLIIADTANDVTAEQVAQALQGIIVSEVTPAVVAAVQQQTANLSVQVDGQAIANTVADTLRSRLLD